MDTPIMPITDFIRRFGHYADLLPRVRGIILTRDGRPYAEIRLSNQERNRRLLEFAGTWEGTGLDNDKLWGKVFTRRNRKRAIKL